MKSRWLLAFILAGWTAGPCVAASTDTSTLHGKMIMGYQGWFACPNDGSGRGWVHWTNDKGTPYVDLLPDVTQLDPDELCESGWKDSDGRPIQLFSSQNAKTVDRHFRPGSRRIGPISATQENRFSESGESAFAAGRSRPPRSSVSSRTFARRARRSEG